VPGCPPLATKLKVPLDLQASAPTLRNGLIRAGDTA
jgi:hypothetical protein